VVSERAEGALRCGGGGGWPSVKEAKGSVGGRKEGQRHSAAVRKARRRRVRQAATDSGGRTGRDAAGERASSVGRSERPPEGSRSRAQGSEPAMRKLRR